MYTNLVTYRANEYKSNRIDNEEGVFGRERNKSKDPVCLVEEGEIDPVSGSTAKKHVVEQRGVAKVGKVCYDSPCRRISPHTVRNGKGKWVRIYGLEKLQGRRSGQSPRK